VSAFEVDLDALRGLVSRMQGLQALWSTIKADTALGLDALGTEPGVDGWGRFVEGWRDGRTKISDNLGTEISALTSAVKQYQVAEDTVTGWAKGDEQ
jgi:hypothetical protein